MSRYAQFLNEKARKWNGYESLFCRKSNPEDPLLNEFLEATTDKNGKSILTVIVACCAGHFAVVNFSFVVETESKCNRCSSLQHQDLENFCSTTDE